MRPPAGTRRAAPRVAAPARGRGPGRPRRLAPLLAALLLAPAPSLAVTPPGSQITNTASARFSIGVSAFDSSSNTSVITTDVVHTPAAIELLQYSPGGAGDPVPARAGACASGALDGPFVDQPPPSYPGTGPLDIDNPLNLVVAGRYHRGEPVFVRVRDLDRNLDDSVRETIEVTVSSAPGGDRERVRLTETTADSGTFVGFVATSGGAVALFDCVLAVGENSRVDAAYIDPFDATDAVDTSRLVDPFGVVFDSTTGAPVDGITVRLVNAATGQPAVVFGDDGVSSYPASLSSGGSAADSTGQVYNFPTGGYRFPFVPPGNYRLELEIGAAYTAPSQRTESELQALAQAPFSLDAQASFGRDFVLSAGPPFNVDIPVDPFSAQLFLDKSVDRTRTAIGEFVRYTLTLRNPSSTVTALDVVIADRLAPGFRYEAGTVRRDGAALAEPAAGADARDVDFRIGTLAPDAATTLTYLTRVGAGTPTGTAVNTARATATASVAGASVASGAAAGNGVRPASSHLALVSNRARVQLRVEPDLFERSRILGRVAVGCEAGEQPRPGVAGIRVLMEDGRYAISDEAGQYHFEGLRPGTHLVQIDPASVPAHLELAECEDDTRVAGSAGSRFVDFRGGTLWRVDFQLREKPPLEGEVTLRLRSRLDADTVRYTLVLAGAGVVPANRRLTVMLPHGLEYLADSSVFAGRAIDDPEGSAGALTYRLGDVAGHELVPGDAATARWHAELEFAARLGPQVNGELATRALLTFDTRDASARRSAVLENRVLRKPELRGEENYIFRPRFASLKSDLTDDDRAQLDQVVERLHGKNVASVRVIGHTDSRPIRGAARDVYADNQALSEARAGAVAVYLAGRLGLGPGQIEVIGRGAERPIADNETADGRAANRRVELQVITAMNVAPEVRELTRDDSGRAAVSIRERRRAAASDPAATAVLTAVDPGQPDGPLPVLGEPDLAFVEPASGFLPSVPSLSVTVAHHPDSTVSLLLGERPVPGYNFEGAGRAPSGPHWLSTWRGIDLLEGENLLVAVAHDAAGREIGRSTRRVHYAGGPASVSLLAQDSRLVADGRSEIVVAVQLRDRHGAPVREGVVGEYQVLAPHAPSARSEQLRRNPLGPQQVVRYRVGAEGTAELRLAPSQRPGKVRVRVPLADGDSTEVSAWLLPEQRDWVLVGVAEGTVGYNTLSGNAQAADDSGIDEDFYEQGRVAFYAKGRIRGEYLLTLAYDTDKRAELDEEGLRRQIDPERFYTLYGDASEQRFDAGSTRKLYVRLEREQFYALFGDFDTGLTMTELGRYNRSMTGLKSEFQGETFGYTAYAAETELRFVRDELRGDGTSGLYRLSQTNLVPNSDKVVIETRDRFHSERVVASRALTRFLDYSIDPFDGSLFFREPVYSQDEQFNPVYIVVDYEVQGATGRHANAGGRASLTLADGKVEIGATVIHEEADAGDGDLNALDLTYAIDDTLTLRAEVAGSDTTGATERDGNAYLAELAHAGDRLQARAYVREREDGFGLGQQNGSETGTRKLGAAARYALTERVDLTGESFNEQIETTGAERTVVAAAGEYKAQDYRLSAGARAVREEDGAGRESESDLLTLGAARSLLDRRLEVRANAELAPGDNAASSDYPERLALGADYRLNESAELYSEHEIAEGDDYSSNATRVGVRATPWSRASLRTGVEERATEDGERTFSTLGMTQGVPVSERWTLDFGMDRTDTLGQSRPTAFNPNAPPASGTLGNDFTAWTVGATYREDLWTANTRFEQRNAEQDDKRGVFAAFYRQHTPGFGLSLSAQYNETELAAGARRLFANLRFSAAVRPLDGEWIFLERVDYRVREASDPGLDGSRSRKIVHNLDANRRFGAVGGAGHQLALSHGVKYAEERYEGSNVSGWSHLLGAEYRHNLTRRWDLGVQSSILHAFDVDSYDYSVGLSAGVNLGRNLWLSVGYNFAGFHDADFTAAGYTAGGPFLRLRAAFDQDSARDFLQWWSREERQEP